MLVASGWWFGHDARHDAAPVIDRLTAANTVDEAAVTSELNLSRTV